MNDSETTERHRDARRVGWLATLSLLLGLGLIALLLYPRYESATRAMVSATVFSQARPLPEFSLLDQAGQSVGVAAFTGSWSLVLFGFTHCPDVCPLTLQILASARRRMDEAADKPRIVFVSVDPERDDVSAVHAYLRPFGAGFVGMTGSLDEINRLTEPLGVYHARTRDANGNYTVDHSAAVFAIDDDGQLRAVFSAPHDATSIANDMQVLMGR